MTDNRARLVGPDCAMPTRLSMEYDHDNEEYHIKANGEYFVTFSNRTDGIDVYIGGDIATSVHAMCPLCKNSGYHPVKGGQCSCGGSGALPLVPQGRIALVGEEPRGEWKRGWLGKNIELYGYEPYVGATQIEYRVVGEGGAEKKENRLYGIKWSHGHAHGYPSELERDRALAAAGRGEGVPVRLTVEPVGEVG